MYPEQATIEVYHDGRWQPAATLCPGNPEQGYRGACRFEYLTEYAAAYAGPKDTTAAALSCRYPVDFNLRRETRWPAFILDILPNGYGRQQWLEQLGLTDGAAADWPLLLRGTAFPPGNLRIAEAVAAKDPSVLAPAASGKLVAMDQHPGFSQTDIFGRNEYFIEYAHQHGIYAAGASDVQGVAPKLLLNQDHNNQWHAEGVLADNRIKAYWLVKWPRGRSEADRQVLKNEAAYMRVAHALGLNVFSTLKWEEDTLFVPRFDRVIHTGQFIERLAMESLYSLAGISEFGLAVSHDTLCQAIIRYCSRPGMDLLEYIKRDIINVVLGNKDNHARNTAVIRKEDGNVSMSPLFDFAPMYLDPEGIARVCRWDGDLEQAGMPDWGKILARYEDHIPDAKTELHEFGKAIERLPEIMESAGVDDEIINCRLQPITDHAKQLLAI